MEKKSSQAKKNTAKSTVLLMVVVALSTIISFLKETIFANYFGTTKAADAYSLAIQIPTIIFSVFSVALGTVVIPIYTKAKSQNSKQAADHFFSNLISFVSLLSLVTSVLLIVFSDFFIDVFAPGLAEETKPVASLVLKISAGTIVFSSIEEANTGILNVNGVYVVPRLITNLRNLLAILLLVFFHEKYGVYASAFGILIGLFFECLTSSLLATRFVSFRFRLDPKDVYIRDSFKMILPVAIGIGITELSSIINKIIASYLSEGSLATISYSTRLISVLCSLAIYPIETTLFPVLSKCASENKTEDLYNTFLSMLGFELMLSLPITIGGMVLSKQLVSIVFERGAFSSNDALVVGSAFFWYLPSFLFQSLRSPSGKFLYSKENTKIPTLIGVVELVLTVGLNCLFTFVFHMGVNGIAISSSISSFFSFLAMFYLLKRSEKELSLKPIARSFVSIFLSGVIMGVCVWLFGFALKSYIGKTLLTVLDILLGCFVYVLMLWIMKCPLFLKAVFMTKKFLKCKGKNDVKN
jgi:putative peptidoglycan lipid II flippase